MKATCDHCDATTIRSVPDTNIVWCATCIRDDIALIRAVDLYSTDGKSMNIRPLDGETDFSLKVNVDKLKLIPKKNANPPQPEVVAVSTVASIATPVATPEPAFDFDKYNSTIPGNRHVFR